MLAGIMAIIPKVLLSIGMKLLSEELLEKLIIYGLGKLSESTKTKVDDELFKMVKERLEK